ncbi:hypothetical protein GIB67_010649, partial [Kingdonia uniflora]
FWVEDLKELIVNGLGFEADDFKISGFDSRDSLVGQSVAYEPRRRWLRGLMGWWWIRENSCAVFGAVSVGGTDGAMDSGGEGYEAFIADIVNAMSMLNDTNESRGGVGYLIFYVQHDVDAGVLEKVILADGAVVTVKASRSHDSPILSLRIVGPTSLTSPTFSSSDNKLKCLALGLVELSSPSKTKAIESVPTTIGSEQMTLLAPNRFVTMWPLTSINGSNSNLRGFEMLLYSALVEKAKEEWSFWLMKADASAQTFVKIVFEVEKALKRFPEYEARIRVDAFRGVG